VQEDAFRADCARAIKRNIRPDTRVVDMTKAADTFAAVLDTLAETLDLGSEERAQRLHLSRYHLDRVVSATGGRAAGTDAPPPAAGAGPAFLDQVRTTVDEGRLDDTFVDVTCDPPKVFTYAGMVAHVLTFAAVRRLVVLGAFENLGITDLDAGDPMEWGARPA
jgi:hypothetical protein